MKNIVNYFNNINRLKNEFCENLIDNIGKIDFENAVDIYYELKKYSINLAVEIGLNIIEKEGKYIEETFFENVEIEIWHNGNEETIELLNRYIRKSKNQEVVILYRKLYEILKEKYKKLGIVK